LGGGEIASEIYRITLALPLSLGERVQTLLDTYRIPFEVHLETVRAADNCHVRIRQLILYAAGEKQRGEWTALMDRHDIGRYATVEPFSYDPAEWVDRWKEYYDWSKVSDRLSVGPDFKPCPFDTRLKVAIDPGQAFGTGSHESTLIALELLDRFLAADEDVLDVGCGTGVLALAACKLGAALTVAFDIEQESCLETVKNSLRNKVSPLVFRGGIEAVSAGFDVVVANMLAHRLLPLANSICGAVVDSGVLVLSGLVKKERDTFEPRFFGKAAKFERLAVVEKNDWWGGAWRRTTQ